MGRTAQVLLVLGPAVALCLATTPRGHVCFVRHGQSVHNQAKLFTGWLDVDLTPVGREEAAAAAGLLVERGLSFDVAFTSSLVRAQETLDIILDVTGQRAEIQCHRDFRLNERHYGKLQGQSKEKAVQEYGREQVKMWRNGFRAAPPPLDAADPLHPAHDPAYAHLPRDALPNSESLHDTMKRTVPFWMECVLPELEAGRNVLISAHAHSIRSLVKYIDSISDDDIARVSLPNGLPLLYALSEDLTPLPPRVRSLDACGLPSLLNAEFLGDQSELSARLNRDSEVIGLDCPLPPPLEEADPEGGREGEGGEDALKAQLLDAELDAKLDAKLGTQQIVGVSPL